MTMLFKTGSMKEKIRIILKLTYEHSRNLGVYVLIYKSLVCVLNRIRNSKSQLHSFISGAIAGYLVFGRSKTAVN